MKRFAACLFLGTLLALVACRTGEPVLVAACVVSGQFVPALCMLWPLRRLRLHLQTVGAHTRWLRSRCRPTAEAFGASESPTPIRSAAEPELLAAVETQLHAWNRLFDKAYLTCNANRFFDDFKRYGQSLSDDRSLFVLLQFAVNLRYAGLVDRLRERHPTLTGYELEMLCMLRFGFTFNTIRLLHRHENTDSLYSRRTKIHRKMHLPPRYPIEAYLCELSESPEPSAASRSEVSGF